MEYDSCKLYKFLKNQPAVLKKMSSQEEYDFKNQQRLLVSVLVTCLLMQFLKNSHRCKFLLMFKCLFVKNCINNMKKKCVLLLFSIVYTFVLFFQKNQLVALYIPLKQPISNWVPPRLPHLLIFEHTGQRVEDSNSCISKIQIVSFVDIRIHVSGT